MLELCGFMEIGSFFAGGLLLLGQSESHAAVDGFIPNFVLVGSAFIFESGSFVVT
jgi:hypothetical protein